MLKLKLQSHCNFHICGKFDDMKSGNKKKVEKISQLVEGFGNEIKGFFGKIFS